MFNFFSLSLKANGFFIKKAQHHLQKIIAVPEAEYVAFIEAKRTEILDFHLKNNTFYKEFFGQSNIKNWLDVPVMLKKDFQKPLSQRLSNGYRTKKIYINKTSGSSGDPFVFAKDKYCHSLTWASIIYRFGWFGINFNKSYQARFYGIPLDFMGNKKEKLKDFFLNRYRFPVFDLSDVFLEKVLIKFCQKKFDYINGYTSSIVMFAKFLQKKNIFLNQICPSLKVCIVTSEMLFAEDKIVLEMQFGVPVVNEYGASELDLIAFENLEKQWQINAETLFIEILDPQGNVLPKGKQGRIVITSLYNKAHPFIRYDIGDIGVLDKKSTAKKPILKKLIGRTNDFAVLPSGKKSPGLTFYYVTKSVIEDDGNVKEFLVKQTKIDTFEVDYVSDFELSLFEIHKIEKAIEQYLEKGLVFIFFRKEKLSREKSGKLKQFVSMIK